MILSLTIFLQAILFFLGLKIFTKTKGLTKNECLLLVLLCINNTFFILHFGNIFLLSNLFIQYLLVYVRTPDYQFALATVSISYIMNILADHIATFLLNYILKINILEKYDYNILWFLLICYLLVPFFIYLARKFYDNHAEYLTSTRGKKFFALSTFSIFFVVYLNMVFEIISGNHKTIVELNLLFFLIIIFIAIISMASHLQSTRKRQEVEQQKREYEIMQSYTKTLEQQYMEIRKFRHDYQNILTSLEGYIVQQNYTELEHYFFENIKPTGKQIQQNNFFLRDLANMHLQDVKSLIASKTSLAQEKNINVKIEIVEPIQEISLSSVSLIRMLGILLDNAVEAVEDILDKQLTIAFIKKPTSIHIIVENTCPADLPKLHVLKKEGFSTKGENRGLGLSNLQDLINANPNCTLSTKISEHHFTQTIVVMKEKENE